MENRPVGSAAVAPAGPTPRRRTEEIGTGEALRLLGTVGLGRIVFTRHALPAVRPVNHLLDDGDIIVRVQDGLDTGGPAHGPGQSGRRRGLRGRRHRP